MLLFMDGFDHYASADGLKKWPVFSGSISASGGRRGGGCAVLDGSTIVIGRSLPADKTTLIVGYALNTNARNNADLLTVLDGATIHCGIRLGAGNEIIAFRGSSSTVLGASAGGVVSSTGFSYLEAKFTIDDTSGAVEVRVDGVVVLSLTGVDTRNGANAYCNAYRIRGLGLGTLIDDHYCCDTTGSTNNDFLGDVRIDTIYPNAAGTHQEWTPSTGADHAALVDETPLNTADYLIGGAAGTKETLSLQNLTVNGAILGVQVNNAVAKSDAGAATMQNLIRSGSAEAVGPVYAPSTAYQYSLSVHETDPVTGAPWLTSGVNALEAGAEVVS